VPTLPRDPGRPGDLDTKTEDHIADETRYACLARPLTAKAGDAEAEARAGQTSQDELGRKPPLQDQSW
jgi:hypothetical protein